MEGWIKLHREIINHWIWSDPKKLKWWIDLLIMVNHEPQKVLIGNTLIECGRGQTIRSLSTLSKRWNVSVKTVRDFLGLLQKDSMIVSENIKISTRITICKYEDYQSNGQGEGTDRARIGHDEGTDASYKQECKEDIIYTADDLLPAPPDGVTEEEVVETKPPKPPKHKFVFNQFYDYQIELSKKYIDKYPEADHYVGDFNEFVHWMFNKGKYEKLDLLGNVIDSKKKNLLSMKAQLSFEEFIKLKVMCKERGISLITILNDMENWNNLKKNKEIYRTAITFINNHKQAK